MIIIIEYDYEYEYDNLDCSYKPSLRCRPFEPSTRYNKGGGRLVSSGVALESQLRVWSLRESQLPPSLDGRCTGDWKYPAVFLRWVDGCLARGFVNGHMYVLYFFFREREREKFYPLEHIRQISMSQVYFLDGERASNYTHSGCFWSINGWCLFVDGGRRNLLPCRRGRPFESILHDFGFQMFFRSEAPGWDLKKWRRRRNIFPKNTIFWEFHARYIGGGVYTIHLCMGITPPKTHISPKKGLFQ